MVCSEDADGFLKPLQWFLQKINMVFERHTDGSQKGFRRLDSNR